MPIALGTRLDTYEIVASLGAGGMGEVYRARDTRLNREVALKVLPEAFAGDPNRLARFEREARTLAALNHSNVAHVYDSGTSGATSYLVMELVAGDDLSALIERGPLPAANALAIARQIAEAIEAAHDAGIVHRDLKPANVKIRPDGSVKVLDFGLAKAMQDFSTPEEIAGSPTITSPAVTMAGVILGTAAYMSPEQARGNPVDRRADIWAFGAVLYEMLTGRRAFQGETVTDLLGAIVRVEPDWNVLPSGTPTAVRLLLQGCLQKDRARRVADISTARFVIDAASSLDGNRSTGSEPGLHRWSIGLAAATAVLAALSLGLAWALLRPRPVAVTRHTVTPASDQQVSHAYGVDTALSPDGSWMVYVSAAPGGGTRLLRRNLDDLDAVAIPGSEGAVAPVVSPDGRSIAFVASGAIRTLPVEGGPPFTVVTTGAPPTWSDDGMIYYGRNNVTYRVPAQGGEPVAVTKPEPNILQLNQDALPGGRGLLLTLYQGTPAQARIAVVGPEGGSPRTILKGTMARYVATGHILYVNSSGTLLAAPFDARRLEVTGATVPIAEGVATDATATPEFGVSRSGSALLYATGPGALSELVWVSRSGVATSVDPAWTAEFGSPALSPDGTRLAVAIQSSESKDIWVAQLDRGPRLRLTLDGARNDYPTWTPDGRSVTFPSDRSSPSFDLWTKRSDGSGEPKLELDEKWALAEAVWSPNGEWFIHRTSTIESGGGDILARRTSGTTKPAPIVASRFAEVSPALSPDGRWLAYASNETGRAEIVVVPFPNAGDSRWPVSADGGSEPLWSRDGRELFYRNAVGEIVSVQVGSKGRFSVGPVRVLFSDRDYTRNVTHQQYDVSPDGQRFIMVRPVTRGRDGRLILVRNAFRAADSGGAD
jgi:Tol biopolymer transport system component/aminoglycoside phosphotransferase (APT) family kinase protein